MSKSPMPSAHAGLFLAVLAQRYAALQALFGEGAVVIVVEEQAGRGVAGHVDIGPAVAVEIGGDGGQGVAGLHGRDTGFALTSVKVPSPLLW